MPFPPNFAVNHLNLWFCLAVVGLFFQLLIVLSFPEGKNSALFKMLLLQVFFLVLLKKIHCLKLRNLKMRKLKIVCTFNDISVF